MTNTIWRIAQVSFTTANAVGCSAFFCEALGFEEIRITERSDAAFGRLMGLPGARAQVRLLRLGQQTVELVTFSEKGRPYPPNRTSADPWFQHIAIVVSDMRAAYGRLRTRAGWTPISTAGPQRLPPSSGGVTAFKFRDPEGHPLELIEFPPARTPNVWQAAHGTDPCLGIDHSAIVVSSSAISAAFYQKLGFTFAARTWNSGIEQANLDAIAGVEVEVTRLQHACKDAPPQLEFLCYRSSPATQLPPEGWQSNDAAATRLVFHTESGVALASALVNLGSQVMSNNVVALKDGHQAILIRDPDEHHLMLTS